MKAMIRISHTTYHGTQIEHAINHLAVEVRTPI